MKVKLIEVLNMIEDKTLNDDERVIIDNDLYYYNKDDKRFYPEPAHKTQMNHRNIYTDKLDLECDLIDRNIITTDIKIPKSTEEIEELDGSIGYYNWTSEAVVLTNKINELVRKVNGPKKTEK